MSRRAPSLFLSAFLVAPVAQAEDLASAEMAGMGGAGVAAVQDNASTQINPAALAFVSRYDFQLMFVGGPNGDLRWSGAAVDGRTSDRIAFGLAYNGGILNTPFLPSELPGWAPADEELVNNRQLHDITFGLGVPFLKRRLSVGINGTLSITEGKYVGNGVTGNIDLAIAARPVDEFSVGFVASDVLPVENQAGTPARLALGLRGGKDDLFLGAVDVGVRVEDVVASPWWVKAGLQGTIRFVKLRAGWDWDGERGIHRVGWGLGLFTTIGSLDYAMQVPVVTRNFDIASLTHTLTLTIVTRLGDREAEERPLDFAPMN